MFVVAVVVEVVDVVAVEVSLFAEVFVVAAAAVVLFDVVCDASSAASSFAAVAYSKITLNLVFLVVYRTIYMYKLREQRRRSDSKSVRRRLARSLAALA